MTRLTMAATFLLLVLGGCDRLGLAGGTTGAEAAADQAGTGTNQAAGNGARAAPDAGLTSSRSLAGLTGAGGDKDPAAVPAGSGAVIAPQMLVGRWADDEGCKQDVTLRPDGTFASYTGGEGTWSVDGDVLSLTGAEGTFAVRVQAIEGDIMTVVNADGSIGRSRRC